MIIKVAVNKFFTLLMLFPDKTETRPKKKTSSASNLTGKSDKKNRSKSPGAQGDEMTSDKGLNRTFSLFLRLAIGEMHCFPIQSFTPIFN